MQKIYDRLNNLFIKYFNYCLSTIIVLIGLSSSINAQIISDNFDSYETGPLSPQALHWTTWSGEEGGSEDGQVTSELANSLPNSILMDNSNGGPSDVLLLLGNQTTGTYALDFNVYVPSDKEGYFNIQEDEVAGVAWNLEAWFNRDGAAPGVGSFAPGDPDVTFDFNHDAWNSIHIVMDLDADLFSFFCNGVPAFELETYTGSIGALDIFSQSAFNMFYMDDVIFDEAEPLSPCPFPTIICDNFDTYDPGFLGPQSDHWTTWSGIEGGASDGLIVTDQFNSAANSLYVGNNGLQDVFLLLGNQITGTFSLDFNVYLPSDKEGYFNIQEDEVGGVAWNLEVWFNRNGAAPGIGSFASSNPDATFDFNHDAWNSIHIVMDLDANLFSFYCNGVPAFELETYIGSIGALDIFSGSAENMFYMDDVVFDEVEPLTMCSFPHLICDNIDDYSIGAIGPQSDHWTTWSGTEGDQEDGIVVDTVFNTAPNSLLIDSTGTQNVLLLMSNSSSSDGDFILEFDLFIPTDASGYFNVQYLETPDEQPPYHVYYNRDGLSPGIGSIFNEIDEQIADFIYPENDWFIFEIDISTYQCAVIHMQVNGDYVLMFFDYIGELGAINFYSKANNNGINTNQMYIDNVILFEDWVICGSVNELSKISEFELFPNPSNGQFKITSEKLFGTFDLNIIDVLGKVIYTEQIELSKDEEKVVNTQNLETGVYILRMVDVSTSKIYSTRVSIH